MPRRRARSGVATLAAVVLVAVLSAPATAAVSPTSWRSPALDGIIQSRPAVVDGVVVVATEQNALYGLSLHDGHTLWGPLRVGDPVPHAVIAELSPAATQCGNIDPLGITSSLAVDTTTTPARVFAVAEVLPATSRTPVHELIGVEATTGRLVVGPTPVDPPAMAHPELEQQRAGLTIANGNVYIGFGGLYDDCGDYHGFVVAAREDGSGIAGSFEVANTVPGNRAGAVWSPAPLPVDATGNLYVATGNGMRSPSEPTTDHSEAVLRLPPTLDAPVAEFQPSTWQADSADDLDLGSTAPVLIGSDLVFQVGKQRRAFLLDASSLGGPDRHTPLAFLDLCTAYGSNQALGSSVFVACSGGVQQVLVDRSTPPRLRHGWTAPVAANGPITVGAGLVWSVETDSGVLYGLDPSTGRVVTRHPIQLDSAQHFPTPALGSGWVVVEASNRVVGFRVPNRIGRART